MSLYTNQELISTFRNVASTISHRIEPFSPPMVFTEERKKAIRLSKEPMMGIDEVKLSQLSHMIKRKNA